MARTSRLTLGLAWLPAVLVLIIPVWLALRATDSDTSRLDLATTLPILGRSLALALTVALASTLIALPLAWLTTRTDLPLRRTLVVLFALPLALPSYVGAYALLSAFGAGGPLATLLDVRPDLYGFSGAAIALTLLGFPYVYLPLQAALAEQDPRLEEAARTLGHSAVRTFFTVSLPLARPALLGGVLMAVMYTLSDFGAVAMLQVDTFTRVIYTQHNAFDRPGAAALGLILVALTAAILALEYRLRRTRAHLASREGRSAHTARPIRLGASRLPALVFAGLVALTSLIAPLLVITWWWLARGQSCDHCTPLTTLSAHSGLIAALTALVAVLLALPVARLATRARNLIGHLPDRILHAGFALPGVVIALALVFAGTRLAPALYQTLPLLVLACVIRFIPQAVDSLRPALERLPPSLEEAARTLGASRLRAFLRVTVPLAMPGLLAGSALVFLTTVKELPATLVMRPTGWDTLATELWDLTNEGYLGEASSRALALVVLGVLPMALIAARRAAKPPKPTPEPP
jgi:iron(III) transport system permease protein